MLPAGEYAARLIEPAGISADVAWRVLPPPGETDRLGLDAAELSRAVRESGGRYAAWLDAGSLWSALPAGRSTVIETTPRTPLWNRWPVLALACGALIGEWWLRKRWGLP
ncbi:MAG: hypothetical protein QM811_26655 [Pirellulales bacterium]